MIVDYDPAKDETNRNKHGVPLLFGMRVFEDLGVVILPTIRIGDEEDRYKAIGEVEGRLWTTIHVWRGETVRLISVRPSNAHEQRYYDCYSG